MNLEELNKLISGDTVTELMIDVDEKVYRDANAVAQSDLKMIKSKSLYHYKFARDSSKETEALILGRAIHKAVFEWDDFGKEYAVLGKDVNLRTKAGKEQRDALLEKGKTVLKTDDMNKINRIVAALRKRKDLWAMLEACQFEKSSFVRHNEHIVKKIRTDGYISEENKIIDLKTTVDASPAVFQRDIWKYHYHWQAAYYCDVVEALVGEAPKFVILAVEKSYPYQSCLFELSPKSMAIGRKGYREELEKLENAFKKDYWPSYETVSSVKPPAWIEKKAFDDIE